MKDRRRGLLVKYGLHRQRQVAARSARFSLLCVRHQRGKRVAELIARHNCEWTRNFSHLHLLSLRLKEIPSHNTPFLLILPR